MTALLKEVEEARGGVVSTSYIADDGRDMDEMDAAITSSAEVISKRLTTFRSVRGGRVACLDGCVYWVGGWGHSGMGHLGRSVPGGAC